MTVATFTQEEHAMTVTYQNRRTIQDTLSLVEKAATCCASAGADDPKDGFVYGLPDTDSPSDDVTLAVQLLRRAQSRLKSWDTRDLRALAADLIHKHGTVLSDDDDVVDIIIRHVEVENSENLPLYAEHIEEVQDMIRRAVIEIDEVRFNEGQPVEPNKPPRHIEGTFGVTPV